MLLLAAVVGGAGAKDAAKSQSVRVADAYVRAAADGRQWSIGSKAVDLAIACRGGRFCIVGLTNKTGTKPRQYVSADAPCDLLASSASSPNDTHTVEDVWSREFPRDATIDLTAEHLTFTVRKGDMLGFAVGPHGDYAGDQIDWPVTLDYGDGEVYSSADDKKLDQGPVWFYWVNAPGSGVCAPMDSVEFSTNTNQPIRIPNEKSDLRSPGITPHIGPSVMHPTTTYDAVRVWRAPKDGTVTLRSVAKHVGYGDTDLRIVRISEKKPGAAPKPSADWRLEGSEAVQAVEGGRPVARLNLTLRRGDARVHFHAMAYPGANLVTLWGEVENAGSGSLSLRPFASSVAATLKAKSPTLYEARWMIGGNNQADSGTMQGEAVGPGYGRQLSASGTLQYTPWFALLEATAGKDGKAHVAPVVDSRNLARGDKGGLFLALDFFGGAWNIAAQRPKDGPVTLAVRLPELAGRTLSPGKAIELPSVSLGVFHPDLDDMAARLYAWQYQYQWDFTHDDWYGLMQFTSAWWSPGDRAQEEFAGRLGYLDADWVDYIRETGTDVLWDDAGWAANQDIWAGNREGPDFAQTVRYTTKAGQRWTLWFPGDPSIGIMDGKQGAWGDFQWRTDGLGFSYDFDRSFRKEVATFLRRHPRSSWQTCSGGGTYSHCFGVQRLGDVHYDTDAPGGDATNYNFSYLELPDRFFDNLATWSPGNGIVYNQWTGRRMLTGAPKWGLYIWPDQIPELRAIADLYRYLTAQGVAGRWSFVTHPEVKGDNEIYTFQRIDATHRKSILILRHKAPGPFTVYPRGLVASANYLVEFASGAPSSARTGAELMARGIQIAQQQPGELIFLNLPNRPGSGADQTAPSAPGTVYTRREVNLGHTGVAVYWSPGADDNWVSGYEVRRGEKVLGRCNTGTFFFDRTPGWDPNAAYSVRTIDGDGNASDWKVATPLGGDALELNGLGAHRPEMQTNGWSAEARDDAGQTAAMKWVPAAKLPSADLGGTPTQPGGAEGWWERDGALIGRGWQIASPKRQCIRAWTAPADGTIRVTGKAAKDYYHRDKGGPLQVRIELNAAQVWPQSGWATAAVGDLAGATHDLTLDVKRGDVVRFVLDKGASPADDILAWMPNIAYAGSAKPASAPSVVRIICGASKPVKDSAGIEWSADRFFEGGHALKTAHAIANTLPAEKDQALYQAGRAGADFTYRIPVKPGLYDVRLKLAEPVGRWFFQRPMTVTINGRAVLSNVDLCQMAGAADTAVDRQFRYVAPDAEGQIVLRFTAGREPTQTQKEALVQAIEIAPEQKTVTRIAVGRDTDFIDWAGGVWQRDPSGAGDTAIASDKAVTQATPTLYDQDLYRHARKGSTITYSVLATPGVYAVHLKFAELWLDAPGKRPMDISINGRRFWHNWDPAQAAGAVGQATDLRADGVTPDSQGRITVVITATGAEDAILQGLEVE